MEQCKLIKCKVKRKGFARYRIVAHDESAGRLSRKRRGSGKKNKEEEEWDLKEQTGNGKVLTSSDFTYQRHCMT